MDIFSVKPRNAEKIVTAVKERYKENKTAPTNNNIDSVYSFADKSRIDVYKSSSIVFTGRHADFCEFREMDMRLDDEPVEKNVKSTPSICSLNFENEIIGSDETGKGEVFKPMIVTAAYTKGADDVLKYISLGVNDSKQIKGKINAIGKEITGISSWQEIMDKPLFSNDLFAVRIISNEEYNRKCHENGDDKTNVQHHLLEEAHLQVLNEMYKKHPDSTVVVDDFTDGKGVKAFKEKFSTSDRIFMTTKGDGKLMAISVASVISCYICNLAYAYTQEMLNKTYKKDSEAKLELPAGASIDEGTGKFLEKLKPELREEFMNKYSKKYFDNIWSVMKP